MLKKSTFDVARVLMALCVFLCHVFVEFNYLGFLFVSVFFFISGYGLERRRRRLSVLTRCIPLLFVFAWFTGLYGMVYGRFLFPCAWYMYVYFAVMVLYRLCPGVYSLLFACCILAGLFNILGFNPVWYASFGAFVFGVFFARRPSLFRIWNVVLFLPLVFLYRYSMAALWALLPMFSYLVFWLCFRPFLSFLRYLSPYTKYFYLSHVFCLGIFGATWTLGGSPSLLAIPALLLAFLFSFFLKEYLFSYLK